MRTNLIKAYKDLLELRESDNITAEECGILRAASDVIVLKMTEEEFCQAQLELDPNY